MFIVAEVEEKVKQVQEEVDEQVKKKVQVQQNLALVLKNLGRTSSYIFLLIKYGRKLVLSTASSWIITLVAILLLVMMYLSTTCSWIIALVAILMLVML